MYHDEFATRKPARPAPFGEDALPAVTLEVGGGLSLGLAASLNQPVSMLLFYLGGLLPLVTCCLSIAASRVAERLAALAPAIDRPIAWAVPTPHMKTSGVRAKAAHHRNSMMGR